MLALSYHHDYRVWLSILAAEQACDIGCVIAAGIIQCHAYCRVYMDFFFHYSNRFYCNTSNYHHSDSDCCLDHQDQTTSEERRVHVRIPAHLSMIIIIDMLYTLG